MYENPTALNLQVFFAIPSIQSARAFSGRLRRLSKIQIEKPGENEEVRDLMTRASRLLVRALL